MSMYHIQYLRRELVTHTRRVQSLYKRMCRDAEAWKTDWALIRYDCSLIRARFEENRHITDMRVAKMLLEDGENEWFYKRHPQPKYFTFSPGGVCYERYLDYLDVHVDTWHAYEKARYPFYMARRETRKREYAERYEQDNPGVHYGPEHH